MRKLSIKEFINWVSVAKPPLRGVTVVEGVVLAKMYPNEFKAEIKLPFQRIPKDSVIVFQPPNQEPIMVKYRQSAAFKLTERLIEVMPVDKNYNINDHIKKGQTFQLISQKKKS